MDLIINKIGNLASLIGSLTVVGSALLWIYNRFIGKPRELKRERNEQRKHQQTMDMIIKENKPLNESIKQLNKWLSESQADRKQLNKIAEKNIQQLDNHEKRLDNHNDRLIILETKNGIQTFKYERKK